MPEWTWRGRPLGESWVVHHPEGLLDERPRPCACRATRNELPALGFDHGPLSCGAVNPPGRRTWRDLAPVRRLLSWRTR